VHSIDEVRPLYEDALGLVGGTPELVPGQRVRVLPLYAAGQRIELVEPAAPDSPVSAFLERRGPGLHHLAWKVESVSEALAELRAAGVRLLDEEPREGAHGTRIAFLHPKATGGVLMELVEEPEP